METTSNVYNSLAKIEVKHPQFEIPNEGPAKTYLMVTRVIAF